MITRVRAIICAAANIRSRFRSGDGSSISRALALADIKREASNSWSTVQDTYLSTKEVFENHRVVFTIRTSIASVLTTWAGYGGGYLCITFYNQAARSEQLQGDHNMRIMQLCRSEISVPTKTAQAGINISPSPSRKGVQLDHSNSRVHI